MKVVKLIVQDAQGKEINISCNHFSRVMMIKGVYQEVDPDTGWTELNHNGNEILILSTYSTKGIDKEGIIKGL